ncbi:hypothetical protein E2F50_13070 [Rhizobium deserti]|uniref:Uncharacterized protein n=1 Tax=Rhizobium deserti TaxID=2547961 RepID=A0A4V6PLX5_9HYPH|nr:hypothetical protein [Rhizobium deserti]TDK35188.1 hypothetical protein E2F50_13070 [Rhizobium deserti]
MAEDVFEILIHDEDGEILLHQQLTKEQAEQAILNFELVKDRPHMALIRAVLSAGVYNVGGKSIFAKRVPVGPLSD